jgi:hypothetical protein
MNLTFLIPVKLESEDRVRNLKTVLTYLLSKFNSKILVQEHDTESKFSELVMPHLNKKFGNISDRFGYTFDNQTEPYFHKTKVLNDLLLRSDTEVVCNYDTDVLLPENSYHAAYNAIMRGDCDAVYPYGCGAYQRAVTYSSETFDEFIKSDMDITSLHPYVTLSNSTIGWCQFVRRENYINSFMMNENFHAWGPEDSEFYYRLNVLGNKVGRVNDYVYHLEHSRTNDSWFSNPLWKDNFMLWNWVREQTGDTILNYCKQQDYVQKRLNK